MLNTMSIEGSKRPEHPSNTERTTFKNGTTLDSPRSKNRSENNIPSINVRPIRYGFRIVLESYPVSCKHNLSV